MTAPTVAVRERPTLFRGDSGSAEDGSSRVLKPSEDTEGAEEATNA